MAKTDIGELRPLVIDDFVTYLQEGTINGDEIARSFNYPGINIRDFDRLIRIHFVLHKDIISYISKLQRRLRRTKIEQQRVKETTRGEIRGPIDWNQTYAQRMATGFNDETFFVIEDPTVEFDIPENRVVKKLLGVIESTVSAFVEGTNYQWTQNWDESLIVNLQHTLKSNVYLEVLPDHEEIEVTKRDISKARRSRHELYSEAARLLLIYRSLLDGRFERPEVQEFLRETIISPVDDHRIFELFCVFGLIRRFRERVGEIELVPIERGHDPIAIMVSDDRRIEIFHDVAEPLSFAEEYPPSHELEAMGVPREVVRHAQAIEEYRVTLGEFLERDTQGNFFGGRPDFLVLDWKKTASENTLLEAVIGEVKYTSSEATFSTGLRELHEYLFLAKHDEDWLIDGELPRSKIHGVICSDSVETQLSSSGAVEHWTTDDFLMEFEPN